MDFKDKRILILGLGETGLSMARHLAAEGAVLSAADTREHPPGLEALVEAIPGVVVACGLLQEPLFENVDAVAVSPGVPVCGPLADACVLAARACGLPFLGDIELFALALAREKAATGYDPKIIAITGTNGKTTVTSLTAHLANSAGVRACAAGNIGPAALDAWHQAKARAAASTERAVQLPEVWVLELSSYQLDTTTSLKPAVAVMLNLTEDHLDRHGSMADYAAAKARIFANQAIQLLNRDDAASMAMRRPFDAKRKKDVPPVVLTFGSSAPQSATDYGLVRESRVGGLTWLAEGGEGGAESGGDRRPAGGSGDAGEPREPRRLMPLDVLKLQGRHNALNVLAAIALNRAIGLKLAPMLKALTGYSGLPHRVQPVATLNGVQYIDDSKGTNVGATLAALDGLGAGLGSEQHRKIVLIAGGEGKGQDFTPLATSVAAYCRAVMLIGHDAPRLHAALAPAGVDLETHATLEAAVAASARRAQSGDVVLLSPACASFDMFRNYGHRAEVFIAAVRDLGRSVSTAALVAEAATEATPEATPEVMPAAAASEPEANVINLSGAPHA